VIKSLGEGVVVIDSVGDAVTVWLKSADLEGIASESAGNKTLSSASIIARQSKRDLLRDWTRWYAAIGYETIFSLDSREFVSSVMAAISGSLISYRSICADCFLQRSRKEGTCPLDRHRFASAKHTE
jgi:hypothetical protein